MPSFRKPDLPRPAHHQGQPDVSANHEMSLKKPVVIVLLVLLFFGSLRCRNMCIGSVGYMVRGQLLRNVAGLLHAVVFTSCRYKTVPALASQSLHFREDMARD